MGPSIVSRPSTVNVQTSPSQPPPPAAAEPTTGDNAIATINTIAAGVFGTFRFGGHLLDRLFSTHPLADPVHFVVPLTQQEEDKFRERQEAAEEAAKQALAKQAILHGDFANTLAQAPFGVSPVANSVGIQAPTHYIVNSGDTPVTIAERYQLDLDTLISLNKHLISGKDFISVGMAIRLK